VSNLAGAEIRIRTFRPGSMKLKAVWKYMMATAKSLVVVQRTGKTWFLPLKAI
jgi:hypothetical protein